MRGKKFFWYQLNIYPTTREGYFKLALVRKWGFHWHCKEHPTPKCKKCTDFGDSTLVAHWVNEEVLGTDLYDVLQAMASAIQAGPEGNIQRQAYLRPLPTARKG